MAATNAPRGLVLARKNGAGSNSTGVTTINVSDSDDAASTQLATNLFTGDPITIGASGIIAACTVAISVKSAGVFQGVSYVDSSGDQKFSRSWVGGTTATDVKVFVASDPDQTYYVQSEASAAFGATGIGFGVLNAQWAVGTGNTRTGNSGFRLNEDTVTVISSHLRVIKRAEWDTGLGTATAATSITDAFPWYEVRINQHFDNYLLTTVV